MMMKKMCGVHKVAWVLLIIGGLNWLVVGIAGKDLLAGMLPTMVWRAIYILVGLSAVSMFGLGKCCMKGGCTCGQKGCSECGGMDKDKAMAMMKPCACGSGKPGWQCCMKGEADKMKGMPCFCGSGKNVEDCCMKSPDTHQKM